MMTMVMVMVMVMMMMAMRFSQDFTTIAAGKQHPQMVEIIQPLRTRLHPINFKQLAFCKPSFEVSIRQFQGV